MPPRKRLTAVIKLQINAGAATPAPPVGPALGQHGVNIMEFCKAYNAATESQRGNVIPVEISVYEDRSFTFVTKTPPAARMLLKAAGVDKGSGEPHKTKVATVTRDQVREIAADQDGRPQRQRPRPGREDHRRHRPVDGHHRRDRLTLAPAPPHARVGGPRQARSPHDRAHQPPERNHHGEARQELPRGGRARSTATSCTARSRPRRWPRRRRPTKLRRHRRGRDAARRRPAQGRPDGPRHGQPAARHRQDRPRHRLRDRRQGRRGRGRRRRRRRLATT